MTTPLNSLPLKTTEYSSDELEDPLIKGVLKEFEEEYYLNKQKEESNVLREEHHINSNNFADQQNAVHDESIHKNWENNNQANRLEHLNYNNGAKKLFDINIAKKALIITLIFFIVFNLNFLDHLLKFIPESFKSYVDKRGTHINILILFLTIYNLFYFELI